MPARFSSRPKQTSMQKTGSTAPIPTLVFEQFSRKIYQYFFEYFNFSERTPLHESSYSGKVEVCQFLVASKADVNAETD